MAKSATAWLYKPENSISKREKATSNICTAQALLATMAGSMPFIMGRKVSKNIAKRIHSITTWLNKALTRLGYVQHNELFFDTLRFSLPDHVSAQKLRTHRIE